MIFKHAKDKIVCIIVERIVFNGYFSEENGLKWSDDIMSGKVKFREATAEDRDFLRDMFYEAVFVPEGEEKPPFDVIDEPVLQKYTYNWMLPTDMGLVVELDGEPVGMFWARLFSVEAPGYGYVDDHTPEVSMAIKPEWQGQGIGKVLMVQALNALREQGHAKVSLSVSKANKRAVGLYRSMGFTIVSENQEDYVMVGEP